jgi:hypothetical protein
MYDRMNVSIVLYVCLACMHVCSVCMYCMYAYMPESIFHICKFHHRYVHIYIYILQGMSSKILTECKHVNEFPKSQLYKAADTQF